ncbi:MULTISPECIES: urea ABC transporter ATP-binding subunit UrtE [Geobacillus]|uniref:ABC transporter ATP-binding protein n=1 Tax=Geobacillus thermocatenulatus TaxID=33938 RepID=A0A226Q1E9_9BACL|nr:MULTISPECIES: urea ABC transporter ATP-binding subunit UrtE [Geobacillus]ASS99327.1 urea ABC transporter ATP-binding subunit UrtE [Geobacillus thermocatenulatus]KLR73216.1 urea ABC transporter ATP-binding protein [Geobacillus sp. T6]KPC97749.1 High-affinity branched-chain amino acid transport ATP-binding protein LivF [Geobacillus sp. BCO2]OXB85744.1 ABC transporter ATP-binding protein [Geobacillus thermocatenulatus]
MLRLRDVTAGYDGSVVLDHVDMNVPLGRVTAVLGRNGVGKTTLMKTIIGLIRPMSGVIEWEGEDITRWPPERRARAGIGYVPQGREIFSALTVEENILLGLEAQAEKVRPQPTLDEMYALFPILKEMRQRKGGDLSGGQQQQLAIARALAGRPKLLLLDEPMEGIQPSIVALIHDAIMKIAEEKQVGIILVEHNVELAFACADHFYIFDRGAVVAKGDVDGADLDHIQSFLAV